MKVVPRKHAKKGVCSNATCQNKTKYKFCATCRGRLSRQSDLVRYAYNNLKNRAKQRGKEFELTLDQFREFCRKTKYIQGKGRSSTSFTVDRIDETKGYTADNIQVLTLSNNIKKKYLSYDWYTKTATVVESCTNIKEVIDLQKQEKFLKNISKQILTA